MLCETAEDETAIQSIIQWDEASDKLVGFCGFKSAPHECLSDASLLVGDQDSSYQTLVDAFDERQVASLARVIMLNPLHMLLPAIPIYMVPTCNRFTAESVSQNWSDINKLYNKHILPVLGPLIGKESYINLTVPVD